MRLLMLLIIASIFSLGSTAQTPTPGSRAPSGNAENGRRLYTDRGCYQCHGYAAQGGNAGPRLAPRPAPFGLFSRYIRQPTNQMPPYTSKVLSDRELADIYAFLRAIPEPAPVENIPELNNP